MPSCPCWEAYCCVCVEGGLINFWGLAWGSLFMGGFRARGGGLFKVSSAGDYASATLENSAPNGKSLLQTPTSCTFGQRESGNVATMGHVAGWPLMWWYSCLTGCFLTHIVVGFFPDFEREAGHLPPLLAAAFSQTPLGIDIKSDYAPAGKVEREKCVFEKRLNVICGSSMFGNIFPAFNFLLVVWQTRVCLSLFMYPLILLDLIRTIYDSRAKLLHSPMGQLLNYLYTFWSCQWSKV